MKHLTTIRKSIFLMFFALIATAPLHAEHKFSIIPQTSTQILITPGQTTDVYYNVTNNMRTRRNLVIQPIAGISQIQGADLCQSIFSLSPHETCRLGLRIDGSEVNNSPTSSINGGPQICNQGTSTFLCSQPESNDRLLVRAYQYLYVVNKNTGRVSKCDINHTTGDLTSCQDSGATQLINPVFIATYRTSSGQNLAYMTSTSQNIVTVCVINATTGKMSNCTPFNSANGVNGLNGPAGIATVTSSQGTAYTYIVNLLNSQTLGCTITPDLGIANCNNVLTGSVSLNYPIDIAINSTSTFAYITNSVNTSNAVTLCSINASGTTFTCNNAYLNGTIGPNGISLNPAGTFIYVTDVGSHAIFVCAVNSSTGALSSCDNAGVPSSLLPGPAKIVLVQGQNQTNYAYITNTPTNTLVRCINQPASGGSLTNCTTLDPSHLDLDSPQGMAIF